MSKLVEKAIKKSVIASHRERIFFFSLAMTALLAMTLIFDNIAHF